MKAIRAEKKLTPFFRDRFSPSITHRQEVNFRQNPTFEDCYPSSTKEYKEVVHEGTGTVLRVSTTFAALSSRRLLLVRSLASMAHALACLLARAQNALLAPPPASFRISMGSAPPLSATIVICPRRSKGRAESLMARER